MRTTIDLPDALFTKVKRLAQARGTTMRDLTIEGLEAMVDRHREGRQKPFRVRDESFGPTAKTGRAAAKAGLVDGLDETDWDRLRDLAYEGRGG